MIDQTETITAEELQVIDNLRSRGFAVALFYPEELGTASPERVADLMVERGWHAIDCLNTEPEAAVSESVKPFRIVEELEDGTDEILDEFDTQDEAEAALPRYLNYGHDAYLQAPEDYSD